MGSQELWRDKRAPGGSLRLEPGIQSLYIYLIFFFLHFGFCSRWTFANTSCSRTIGSLLGLILTFLQSERKGTSLPGEFFEEILGRTEMNLVWVTFPSFSKQWERSGVWGTAWQCGEKVEIFSVWRGGVEREAIKSDHWAPGVLQSIVVIGARYANDS